MNPLIELDQLGLEAATKTQVAVMIQSLLDQANHQASAQLQAKDAQLQAKDAEIKRKDLKIDALTFELARLRRLQFGAKNETLSPLQRDLFAETLAADMAAIEVELEQLAEALPCASVTKPKRPRAGRQPLPEHLPRIEHRHEPESCTCGQCGNALVKISEDVTEQLDVEPAKFFVHRHIRPQYACRCCETITAAAIPPAVIDGGIPSGAQVAAVGLLTWIMIGKFVDHLPLYRLEQIAARDQVTLARSTLAEWVGRVGVPTGHKWRYNRWWIDSFGNSCKVIRYTRTKRQYHNWSPAAAKPGRLTYGPTAATTCKPGRALSSLTTNRDAAVVMRVAFWATGMGICWSMTTVAIKRCLPLMAIKTPVSS
jgi:transposase